MSSVYTDKYNNQKINEITIKKSNSNNLEDVFFYCNSINDNFKYKKVNKKSSPININNQSQLYNYNNDLLGPSSPNDNLPNIDLNLLLSKYSISPNTYDNFKISKYYNNFNYDKKLNIDRKLNPN